MAEARRRAARCSPLLGGTTEDARGDRRRPRGVTVANDNAPGQVVLSGDRGALDEAEEAAARARPARDRRSTSPARSTRRRWSPPSTPFRAALDEVELGDAALPRLSRARTAAPFTDVRAELAEALDPPRPLARDHARAARRRRRATSSRPAPASVLARSWRIAAITKETANA